LKHGVGRKTIAFAQNTEHAQALLNDLSFAGFRCGRVDSTVKDPGPAIAAFKTGEIDVLVNVFQLTEGFDVPAVDCVLLARGCGSQLTWLQSIGRGLRASPGKERCLVLDCKGSVHAMGLPDATREFTLDGEGIKLSSADGESLRQCRACGAWWPCVGPRSCPRCGAALPPPPKPKVRAVDLQHVRGAEPASKKREWWRRKLREAKSQGRKWGWVLHVYRGVYGENVPRDWYEDLREYYYAKA